MSARVVQACGAGGMAVLAGVAGVVSGKWDDGLLWQVIIVVVILAMTALAIWLALRPPDPPVNPPSPPVDPLPSDRFDQFRNKVIERGRTDRELLTERLDLAHFTGRQWLIKDIDDHIGSMKSGYVVVETVAGVGKSALAAHLALTRSYPYHFTSLVDGRSPEQAKRNLAEQLIVAWELKEFVPEPGSADPELLDVLRAAATRRDHDTTHRGRPLVLIVDGLNEAADAPGRGHDTGTHVPLGLPRPEDLPPGVFIVATCLAETPLRALRHSPLTVMCQIAVERSDNLQDMRQFVKSAVTGESAQQKLVRILRDRRVNPDTFIESLLERCGGVWIYLRYVLEEILAGRRLPTNLQTLPKELVVYYRMQIDRWSSDAERWQRLRLPVVTTLVALRRPATRADIAHWSAVENGEELRRWLDGEELRSFLAVTPDSDNQRLYAIQHDSLRELFASFDEFDAFDGVKRALYEALLAAHQRITAALVPAGPPGMRNWGAVDDHTRSYLRASLAEHAAYGGQLDELACDPGFLLLCDPASLLRQRTRVTTDDARAAIAAYELARNTWASSESAEQKRWWLHIWARKTRSRSLADRAVARHPVNWQVVSAMWTGSGHRILTGHTEPVRVVCALPLPKQPLLASAGLDRVVRLWDPVAETPLNRPIDYAVNALCVASLPDVGDVLVSGGADGAVRLWHPFKAEQVGHSLTGHTAAVSAVCALELPGGDSLLVSASLDGTVRFWNPHSGQEVGRLSGDVELVNALCAVSRSDERTVLVSVGAGGTAQFWDPVTRQQIDHQLPAHTSEVSAVCALERPNGRSVLASASQDGMVWFWDPDTPEQVLPSLAGHAEGVSAVCAVPLPNRSFLLVSAGRDRTLRLWDPDNGEQVGHSLTGHTAAVSAVCALELPDGRSVVASAGDDRVLRLWDPDSVRHVGHPLTGHTDEVSAVCEVPLLNKPSLLASAGRDRVLRLWDPVSGDPVGPPLTAHNDGVSAVCALTLPGGRTVLASGGVDGTVRLWDPEGGDQFARSRFGHTGEVRALCALTLPDGGRVFASASLDRTVRLWDPQDCAPVGDPLTGHTDWVSAVCEVVLPDGRRRLASAGHDRVLRLWDPVAGEPVGTPLTGHTGGVNAVCTTLPDGRGLLVSAGDDPMLRLWDPVSGEQVKQLPAGHTGLVRAVCPLILPGGRNVLASGGVDGAVRLRDPASGEQLGHPLAGHTGRVTAVCPLPQPAGHSLMATAGEDCTVLVWGPRSD